MLFAKVADIFNNLRTYRTEISKSTVLYNNI